MSETKTKPPHVELLNAETALIKFSASTEVLIQLLLDDVMISPHIEPIVDHLNLVRALHEFTAYINNSITPIKNA